MDPLPTTILSVMKSVNADIRTVGLAEFYGILKEKAKNMDCALCGVVIDSVRSNALNTQIVVSNAITMKALIDVGYYPQMVNVDMVLNEFRKGE